MVYRNLIKKQLLIFGTLLLGLTSLALPAHAVTVDVSYMYTLSDFTGPILYGGGNIFVDKERNEAYVLFQNIVTVFNSSSVAVYQFGNNKNLGQIRDLAVKPDGSILLLTYNENAGKFEVIHCNFQGDPKAKIPVTGLPAAFNAFQPNHIAYRDGSIYLADDGLLVAVVDLKGNVQHSLDLYTLLELDEKDRNNVQLEGFSVDRDGSILLTLPVLFTAYRVTLDGKVSSFGKPGSLPGNFGVVSGIIADNRGNYLVADKLKCVVDVFDKDFRFVMEFGHRGTAPENLIVPLALAIDGNDRVYVVQSGNRGISVFRMQYSN